MTQLALFKEHSKKKYNFTYGPITVKEATFKSGVSKAVHNWFRLTPSFGPGLVDVILDKLEHKQGQTVMDPFCGASTTLIQCKQKGISSFGFEINPFLHFVGQSCLNWDLDVNAIENALQSVKDDFANKQVIFTGIDVELLGIEIPKIHNVFRWWRRDVLKDLLLLKQSIKALNFGQSYKDFFLLALANVLVPDLTNVTLGRLQLHFVNKDNKVMNVFDTFFNQVKIMIDGLTDVQSKNESDIPSILYLTDTTELDGINVHNLADIVITSPPYPNRYSYVWNTRPHLYFLEIFDNAKQASSLDTKTIGGTWGVATSNLMKGTILPAYDVIDRVVEPIVKRIRENDNLMANYVMKYFNLIAKQIIEMEKVTTNTVKCAYVVGNSEIKGVYVETDTLLAEIFEGLGLNYEVSEIHRFRKRNSGVDLYESIVYATKQMS
jgi:hypothetical protein